MRVHVSKLRPVLALLILTTAAAGTAMSACSDDVNTTCPAETCLTLSDGSTFDVSQENNTTWPDADHPADTADASDLTDTNAGDSATDAGDSATDAGDSATNTGASDAAADASDGGPVPLATGLNYPWRISFGGGYVYATVGGDVAKIPIGGGSVQVIKQSPSIEWIAADANNLYFTTLAGTVYKRAHDATSSTAISNNAVALTVYGLTTDGTYVYWTEYVSGGQVKRVAVDGSTMAGQSVSPGLVLPKGIAFAGAETYVAESAGNTGTGRILRINADGGAPFPLASGRTGPSLPVVDSNRIYWFEDSNGTGPIKSMPLAGGTIDSHANSAISPSLLTDGNVFYYGNATGGIVKIDVSGATTTTLYGSGQTGDVYGLVVAGNALYWTDYNGGRVMTAPK